MRCWLIRLPVIRATQCTNCHTSTCINVAKVSWSLHYTLEKFPFWWNFTYVYLIHVIIYKYTIHNNVKKWKKFKLRVLLVFTNQRYFRANPVYIIHLTLSRIHANFCLSPVSQNGKGQTTEVSNRILTRLQFHVVCCYLYFNTFHTA